MTVIIISKDETGVVMAADTQRIDNKYMVCGNDNKKIICLDEETDFYFGHSGTASFKDLIPNLFEHLKPYEENIDDTHYNYLITTFVPVLKEELKTRQYIKRDENNHFDEMGGNAFLFALGGEMFLLGDDFDLGKLNNYFAIGTGAPYAMGVMKHYEINNKNINTTYILRKAINVACELDCACGGEPNIVKCYKD